MSFYFIINMDRKYTIGDFEKEADIRKERAKYKNDFTATQTDLYDSFINLIVNHKMELQKIPAASHPKTAKDWAEKRHLRSGQEDFNGDGLPETVIYNNAGQPMIINGYKLRKSDYGIRNMYWGANRTKADRLEAGPMKEWIREKSYSVDVPDEKRYWHRNVSTTADGLKLKSWGYKMPTKPKKQLTVFQDFCKRIATIVKAYFDGYQDEEDRFVFPVATLLGSNAGPTCSKFIKKIISPLTIYRMLYMKIVERWYFFHLKDKVGNIDYAYFKRHCKQYPENFWVFYRDNVLDANTNYERFIPQIYDMSFICRLFADDKLDTEGNDPNDAIVFLISTDNFKDGVFVNIAQNETVAKEWFDSYNAEDKAVRRPARKFLEICKERAKSGTKEFFKDIVTYLMEDKNAFDQYKYNNANGKFAIDPNFSEAQPKSKEEQSVETNTNTSAISSPTKVKQDDEDDEEGFNEYLPNEV